MMALRCAAVALIAMLVTGPASAVVLTKCQAAQKLYAGGIAKADLPNWMCLIQWESSFNTAATHTNTNGSTDYGIFQINSTYWCGKNAAGGDCNVKCSALIDNDITNDIACAKIIYRRHGYNAWYGWINHCQSGSLPSVSECF